MKKIGESRLLKPTFASLAAGKELDIDGREKLMKRNEAQRRELILSRQGSFAEQTNSSATGDFVVKRDRTISREASVKSIKVIHVRSKPTSPANSDKDKEDEVPATIEKAEDPDWSPMSVLDIAPAFPSLPRPDRLRLRWMFMYAACA